MGRRRSGHRKQPRAQSITLSGSNDDKSSLQQAEDHGPQKKRAHETTARDRKHLLLFALCWDSHLSVQHPDRIVVYWVRQFDFYLAA